MKFKLVAVHSNDRKLIANGFEDYVNRLKHYVSFELVEIHAKGKDKSGDIERTKQAESDFDIKDILEIEKSSEASSKSGSAEDFVLKQIQVK